MNDTFFPLYGPGRLVDYYTRLYDLPEEVLGDSGETLRVSTPSAVTYLECPQISGHFPESAGKNAVRIAPGKISS